MLETYSHMHTLRSMTIRQMAMLPSVSALDVSGKPVVYLPLFIHNAFKLSFWHHRSASKLPFDIEAMPVTFEVLSLLTLISKPACGDACTQTKLTLDVHVHGAHIIILAHRCRRSSKLGQNLSTVPAAPCMPAIVTCQANEMTKHG